MEILVHQYSLCVCLYSSYIILYIPRCIYAPYYFIHNIFYYNKHSSSESYVQFLFQVQIIDMRDTLAKCINSFEISRYPRDVTKAIISRRIKIRLRCNRHTAGYINCNIYCTGWSI